MKDILLDNDLDIRDLGLETQLDTSLTFDPQVDITPEDFAKIYEAQDYFTALYNDDRLFDRGIEYCARLRMLGAQLPGLEWLTIGRINKAILDEYTDDDGLPKVSIDTPKIMTLGQLVIIDPSFREKLRVDDFKGEFGEKLSGLRKEHVFYPIDCFFARVVYGEQFREFKNDQSEPFYNAEAFRAGVRSSYFRDKTLSVFDPKSYEITNALDMLVAQKVIEPGDGITFTPRQWQYLHYWLDGFRKENNWTQFLSLASSMYLLSAEKVELTPEGFQLTFPEPSIKVKKIADIPQVRSYQ